jgi:hypothetical protein
MNSASSEHRGEHERERHRLPGALAPVARRADRNGSASWLIVALPAPSRSSAAQRVGSAKAAKARSTVVENRTWSSVLHAGQASRQCKA